MDEEDQGGYEEVAQEDHKKGVPEVGTAGKEGKGIDGEERAPYTQDTVQ